MDSPTLVVENVEHATVERAKTPAAASITMPDHEVRQARWYQLYVRLARPTLDWIADLAALYGMVIAPATGRPLDDGYLVQVLLFVGTVYGVRSFEKVKGVA